MRYRKVNELANNFFKNGDKAYAENLNDGVLVGNAFDWTVDVVLPADTGSTFPNSSTVSKAKVCDVSITPNSNLSIGSTISNSSGSSQVYRLTVYPNFNRFGGFKSISLTADSGVTFYIANKGGTSAIANNLDYTDLSNVPELKVLKEYDIVVTIPTGKSVTGLSFVLQSDNASVSASLAQSNVTGLTTSLNSKVNVSDIVDNLTTNDATKVLSAKQGKALEDGKSPIGHTHDDRYYTEEEMGNWTSSNPNSYTTIYVNATLRLVEFKYYRTNYNFSNIEIITLHSGAIPSDYRPKVNSNCICYDANLTGTVTVGGDINVNSSVTGTRNINFSAMWHY